MGGFGGIGHSGAKTDRANQLAAGGAEWNIFNYGMPQAQQQQAQGQQNLQAVQQYGRNLLTGGRQFYSQQAAPATNAAQMQSDAATRQAAATGTSRGGGTAAANASRQTTTQKSIDDIINQNLVSGRTTGAQLTQGVASAQLQNSANLLGVSQQALEDILSESTKGIGAQNNQAAMQDWGQLAGVLLGGGGGGGAAAG